MEKTKAAIISGKALQRLCWLLLGAAVVFAAVQYLRVTQLMPLGEDDKINIPSTYYAVTHTPALRYIWDAYKSIFLDFPFSYGRFFPLGSMPRYIRYLSYGSVASYRLYLILFTLTTAAAIALLLARITESKPFGMSYLALVPMMFCLWNTQELNGLYSYATTALFPVLMFALASHAMVSWGRRRKWYWAVLTGALTFWCCASYETGYIYIFAMGFLALLLNDRFWASVCTGLPALCGELAAFAMYVGNYLNQSIHYTGTVIDAGNGGNVLLTWAQQISGGFPVTEPLMAHAWRSIPYAVSDWLWPLLLALTAALCLALGRVRLGRKQAVCLFCAGLCMLVFPALLVAVSGKYNSNGWVSWTSAYIPAASESFGVGLMALVLWAVLLQWLSRLKQGRVMCCLMAAAVALALMKCSAWQRALVREDAETYKTLESYEFLARSLENGIADGVADTDTVVCDYDVWGGDAGAETAFFQRYTGRELDVYQTDSWQSGHTEVNGTLWRVGYCHGYEKCGGVWICGGVTEDVEYGDGPLLYLDGDHVPDGAEIRYTANHNGEETIESVKLSELTRSDANSNNEYYVELPAKDVQLRSISLVGPEE